MRSTSAQMRSASSQMSRVNSRSLGLAFCSSSCAAPRMPESGFFTSCASIEAMAVTERAALRWVSWRSILLAMLRSCSITTTRSCGSDNGAAWMLTKRTAGRRGVSSVMPYSDTLWPESRTLSISAKSGPSAGRKSASLTPISVAALLSKKFSAAELT